MAVEVFVVRLVAIVEEAFVACLTASLYAFVFPRVRVEVADLERLPSQQREHGGILGDLAQHAGTAFGRFVKENLLAVLS